MSYATQRHDADCLPAAVASVLEVPLELLPDISHDEPDWFDGYNRKLREGGWPFALVSFDGAQAPIDGRWIAVVPSLIADGWHAVVMDGSRLLHDPGAKVKYQHVEPSDMKCGIFVAATGPGWGPGRDPTWVPKELTGATPGPDL